MSECVTYLEIIRSSMYALTRPLRTFIHQNILQITPFIVSECQIYQAVVGVEPRRYLGRLNERSGEQVSDNKSDEMS